MTWVDDQFERHRPCSSNWEKQAVKTTKTSTYDDGEGPYVVMSTKTVRSWKKDQNGAIDHARNIITRDGGKGEFLILKVVGRVKPRGKHFPTTFTKVK